VKRYNAFCVKRTANSDTEQNMNSVWIQKGHSTGLYTHVVKRTIEYYVDRGSHVFATFIDFTQAFDRVNYWILFNQLLDDGVDFNFVCLLVYWYTNQQARVRWHNTVLVNFP